jgi:hypothetical protein
MTLVPVSGAVVSRSCTVHCQFWFFFDQIGLSQVAEDATLFKFKQIKVEEGQEGGVFAKVGIKESV